MKNKAIKLVCLLLCLCLALSAFAGCKGKASANKKKKKSAKKAESTASEEITSDTASEDWIDDEDGDDDFFEEDDPDDDDGDDEEEEEPDSVAVATVSNSAPLTQNVMGAGMGLYNPFAFTDNEIVTDDEVANVEFDRLQNMGVHTVRGMFKFEWLDEKRNDGVWNWDSYKMQAYYKWLKAMKDRNINVFVNPWSFGHINNIASYRYWDTKCFYADTFEKTIDNWANAMTEVMLKLQAKGYTNANGLLLFTEPIYSDMREKISDVDDRYVYMVKLIDKKLKDAGIRQNLRLMGPNYSNTDTALIEKCMTEAYDCLDVFSQHRYATLTELTANTASDVSDGEYGGFVEKVKELNKENKPFWIDEYNVSADTEKDGYGTSTIGFDNIYRGIQQAAVYNSCMNMGGVNGMMIWTIADQQWPENRGDNKTAGFYQGVLYHGLLGDMNKTLVPKSQYYAFSLLSKYTGTKGNTVYRVECDNLDVTASAIKMPDGNWTFIVTNTNIENTLFKLDFEKQLSGLKLYRHQYVASEVKPTNAAHIIPANKTIKNVKTGFTDVLEPYSVTVYTTVKG